MSQKENPSPSFLSDLPAERDILDYSAYRDALVSIINGLTGESSLTIAIFGAWGSGKTTLLKMVQGELEKNKTQAIWVNVWQFGNEEDVWTAFLQSLLLKIKREMPLFRRYMFDLGLFRRRINWDAVSKKVPELLIRFLIVVVPFLIAYLYRQTIDPSGKIAVGAGTFVGAVLGWFLLLQPYLKAVRERVKVDLTGLVKSSQLRDRVSQLDQFKTYFEDMVVGLVGPQGRAIIFVDDLDRCQPDRIVQVLDAIKLFLDIPRCVYLIGLDREIIEQAIKVKFDKYKNPELEAREYLEKIIGLPFDLPPLSGPQMQILVHGLAAGLPDADLSTQVFALGQEPNPRKVKRTINMFLMSWLLAQARKELEGVIKPTRLAKVVVLQHSYRDLYLILTLFPGYLGEIEAYFRGLEKEVVEGTGSAGEREAPTSAPAAPPDHIKAFVGNDNLRRLLTLHPREDEDANFTTWRHEQYVPIPEEEVSAYIRLTRTISSTTQKQAPAAVVPPTSTLPRFINRQRELDTFFKILGGNIEERILLVEGASGMGKTALLRRYRDVCSERSIPFVHIQMRGFPGLGIIDFMKTIREGFPQVNFRVFDDVIGAALPDSQTTQALMAGLHAIAANSKAVIFIDNFEQCTEELRDWIVTELLPRLKDDPNLIVCIAGQATINTTMIHTGFAARRLVVGPFTQADIADYLRQMNVEIPNATIEALYAASRGSPSLIAGFAKRLKETV